MDNGKSFSSYCNEFPDYNKWIGQMGELVSHTRAREIMLAWMAISRHGVRQGHTTFAFFQIQEVAETLGVDWDEADRRLAFLGFFSLLRRDPARETCRDDRCVWLENPGVVLPRLLGAAS